MLVVVVLALGKKDIAVIAQVVQVTQVETGAIVLDRGPIAAIEIIVIEIRRIKIIEEVMGEEIEIAVEVIVIASGGAMVGDETIVHE
jgi:hypothetical protein